MTAGTIFLMWLGEQIDEYGIGNGISLIIMAGIVARMPWAMYQLFTQMSFSRRERAGSIGPGKVLFLVVAFVVRGGRGDPDHPGPATDPDPAGQADARPPHVRRRSGSICRCGSTTAA